jgi:hypothetical protein
MVYRPPYRWYFYPLSKVYRPPYLWYIDLYPLFIDHLPMVCRPLLMAYRPPTNAISTPSPWYIDPPYTWYFDPPTHGILTPLPMAL